MYCNQIVNKKANRLCSLFLFCINNKIYYASVGASSAGASVSAFAASSAALASASA